MELTRRLRAMREARGLTQAELSARTGISVPSISAIESGRRDIRVSTLLRIVKALNMDIAFEADTDVTVEEVSGWAQRGRARLELAALGPSQPEARLAFRERSGRDVGVERAILDRSR